MDVFKKKPTFLELVFTLGWIEYAILRHFYSNIFDVKIKGLYNLYFLSIVFI